MDAQGHAERASTLLVGVENRLRMMDDLTPDQHLQMVAGGGFKQHNSEIDTSLSLARTHALTSLALQGIPVGALAVSGDRAADAAAVADVAEQAAQ